MRIDTVPIGTVLSVLRLEGPSMRVLTALLLALLAVGCRRTCCTQRAPARRPAARTDSDQRRADQMEGFRFHAQRPHVVVLEPFPVHAVSFVVEGTVAPDGRHVRVSLTDRDERLFQALRASCSSSDACSVPWSDVHGPRSSPRDALAV